MWGGGGTQKNPRPRRVTLSETKGTTPKTPGGGGMREMPRNNSKESNSRGNGGFKGVKNPGNWKRLFNTAGNTNGS